MTAEQVAAIRAGRFTTKGEGHGFGLRLIQEIVRRHGGFLEIESEPGEGTVFTVSIRKEDGAEGGPEQQAALPAERIPGK